jgi:hypothetical protein
LSSVFLVGGFFNFPRSAVDCFDLTNFFPYFFFFFLHHLINSGLESAVLVLTIVSGFFLFFLIDFARALAEFRLSDEQLALYSGYILLQDDRQGLRNASEVRQLNQAVLAALHRELTNNPPHVPTKGDVSILQLLTNRRLALREISFLHTEALVKFKSSSPGLEFPALHRELFPT